ncbi:aminotransferase class V-fold PLP-dependent enzyme [Microbacterium sp. C7(2022)]|uniref:aminotransferase class V-fold PLP-dependent enzyme n=1 Tax=Microbacterium sp. C7(2022) TaxID=2992759 RepID=UPI00237B03EF|nr:aminotransferase class V-fold PLP-dependent enzyme [Microbacterium sp. C7(2022)]MDE0545616.1 aminotransferase class V-fold PLP-dependent enzyme [Microbacterium sp. C7(2022)]
MNFPSTGPAVTRLEDAQAQFVGGRGYLAACTSGLPTLASRAAVIADMDAATNGRVDLDAYCLSVEASRASFASLVGVSAERVAIGSQSSVAAALVAASLPQGAEVLIAEGDFSSIVLPFIHAGRGLRVRTAPLRDLAGAIDARTHMVVFSVVQSATGEVADAAGIVAEARRHGARTFCDATQAVGWLPVRATDFDALVCHAYKWLCAPRGVAFLTLSDALAADTPALFAGWYAGADPWATCYGGDGVLAPDITRFDVSPAWQAFVGAEPALALLASVQPDALYSYTTGLATRFRAELGLPEVARPSAIVTWDDPHGDDLRQLAAAGITASGRAGRARVAFHIFNDVRDVDTAARAVTQSR